MKMICFVALVLCGTSVQKLSAQTKKTDSVYEERMRYLRVTLRTTDSVKLNSVEKIQSQYKAELKTLMNSKNDRQRKSNAFRSLVETRNRRLRAVLTPGQFERLVPTTERFMELETNRNNENPQ